MFNAQDRPAAFVVNPDHTPAVVELAVRESTTAPNRIKVGFVMEFEEGAEIIACGAAAEQMGEVSPLPEGAAGNKGFIAPEFRIELN